MPGGFWSGRESKACRTSSWRQCRWGLHAAHRMLLGIGLGLGINCDAECTLVGNSASALFRCMGSGIQCRA